MCMLTPIFGHVAAPVTAMVWSRDHGMDTQDLEFKFFAKRVETSYVVTATYV